jgi:hypothetical protein
VLHATLKYIVPYYERCKVWRKAVLFLIRSAN